MGVCAPRKWVDTRVPSRAASKIGNFLMSWYPFSPGDRTFSLSNYHNSRGRAKSSGDLPPLTPPYPRKFLIPELPDQETFLNLGKLEKIEEKRVDVEGYSRRETRKRCLPLRSTSNNRAMNYLTSNYPVAANRATSNNSAANSRTSNSRTLDCSMWNFLVVNFSPSNNLGPASVSASESAWLLCGERYNT